MKSKIKTNKKPNIPSTGQNEVCSGTRLLRLAGSSVEVNGGGSFYEHREPGALPPEPPTMEGLVLD